MFVRLEEFHEQWHSNEASLIARCSDGHLATMMNAHFCAVVPNLRIMEIDPDHVPWYDDLVTVKPRIEGGQLFVPTGPGWGTEVNEEALRAHPPRER